MVQPDMKKLVAYSSVSHLGFVVLGLCAMNVQGVQGAVYQMLNHGVSTGGLFMIVGMLSDRRHTRLISEFGGLKAVMPRLVAAFLLITLSSIALPGLNGFVGEFLILARRLPLEPRLAALAATGVILSAVYMLWMFQRVNYGDHQREEPHAARPDAARVGDAGADDRDGHRDGRRSRALPAADGAVGQPRDRAGDRQPAGAVDDRSGALAAGGPALMARRDAHGRAALAPCREPNSEPRATNDGSRTPDRAPSNDRLRRHHPDRHRRAVGAAPPCSPRRSASPASACRSPGSGSSASPAPPSRRCFLWGSDARSFGVIRADNFALFINIMLCIVGVLTMLFSDDVVEREDCRPASTTR